MPQRITPNLWFDTEAEEAANDDVSVFKDGRVVNVSHYTEGSPRQCGWLKDRYGRRAAEGTPAG
jgi:predicted 3-demethylubiquinone-9 3-methyltransferase (glyoxalase superfamily)